jgi:hypothetical protein
VLFLESRQWDHDALEAARWSDMEASASGYSVGFAV